MKTKILIAFITIYLTAVSCSKDEDEIRTDTIIGTWQISKMGSIQNGVTMDSSTDCDKKSTIIFTNKGEVLENYYYIDQETKNCIQFVNDEPFTGKWKKKSNNNYTISFETADGSQGYEYGMSSIIFPDNDTMYFNYNDGMGGEESYREEYNRIE